MAVVAGWLLHCELHKGSDAAMTHIAFRQDVTMSLLQLKQKLTGFDSIDAEDIHTAFDDVEKYLGVPTLAENWCC
ncbi:hypothetical protein MRX96_006995 [Rhipicephalus microplus]